jgi:thiamine pyrophosphate-dependent acetolactate synthase large subunit-like protein
MSLGALVTVVGTGVTNFTIVVLDNGMYEVTGGQKTAASGTAIDLPGLARAAGFPTAVQYRELADWLAAAASTLSAAGPRFVSLRVGPTPKELLLSATPPIGDQLDRFRSAIGSG